VNEPSPVDLVDWLSTLAIIVTIAAALIGGVGAACTSLKIRSNQRASQKETIDAARYKKRATRFEVAANVCQYVAIATAIGGGIIGSTRLLHERVLRAEAKAEKARLADELTATRRAAASASALAEEERRARFQRELSRDDVARILKELNFPMPTQGTRIELIVSDRDGEAFRFAIALDEMLMFDARWVVSSSSCGLLAGDVHSLVMEMKPELFELAKPRPDSGPYQMPPEFNNAVAAWALVRAVRQVRPDLTISDPRPWSQLSFEGASYSCLRSVASRPDGGKQPEAMSRLIIGSR